MSKDEVKIWRERASHYSAKRLMINMIRESANLDLWFISTLFLALLTPPSSALNSDGTLLLSFKYSILSDPLSVLENWNYDDLTPCSWTGVSCAATGSTPDPFRVISLVLPNCNLLGSVPEELGFIQHLRTLDLSNNSFNGTLPTSLFNSSQLQVLSLSSNVISGGLPEFSGSLHFLNLSDNALAGEVPESLASQRNLTVVSLRTNYLSGSVPSGFDSIEVLDLSSNLFNGSLPLEFGGEKLRYLNLSYNKLSGSVSPEFAKKIPPNATIDLSFNNLSGQIPQSSPALVNQKTEYFAGNTDLCGRPLKKICTIPSTLSTPPNTSTNSTSPAAIAAIPKTIDSSPLPNATGDPGEAKTQTAHGLKVKPGKIAAIVVGDFAGIGLLALVFLYIHQTRKNRTITTSKDPETPPPATKDNRAICSCLNAGNGDETSETATGSDLSEELSRDKNASGAALQLGGGGGWYDNIDDDEKGQRGEKKVLVMVDGETEMEMETLLKASAYVLGSTGSSIVYKAVVEGGAAFAVRRIGEGRVERLKEFEKQVRVIAKLKHPNLVRVRGFYWGEDEKLVIYDYVSHGSLATAGYKKVGSSPCHLPFEIRLKIAKGIARGLTYIHEKKHVHGNIKPSNVLLTPDMDPVISDFGLEWLVSGRQSYKTDGWSTRHFGSKRSISSRDDSIHNDHNSPYGFPANGFMGCTSPYHAPESLKSMKPNAKWDVYSFGIILLELLTGKVFSDRELGQWNSGSWAGEDNIRILRMADVAIRADVNGREEATLACFRLGFSCASLVPQKRPSMKEALQILEKMPCLSH